MFSLILPILYFFAMQTYHRKALSQTGIWTETFLKWVSSAVHLSTVSHASASWCQVNVDSFLGMKHRCYVWFFNGFKCVILAHFPKLWRNQPFPLSVPWQKLPNLSTFYHIGSHGWMLCLENWWSCEKDFKGLGAVSCWSVFYRFSICSIS